MDIEVDNEPQPLRIIGIPKRKDGRYVLDEFAIINRECGWICPRCNEEVRICPTKAGEQTFTCKHCNASFTLRVDADASTFMLSKKKPATASSNADVKSGIGLVAAAVAQKPARGMLLMADDDDPAVKNYSNPEKQVSDVECLNTSKQKPQDSNDDADCETRLGTNTKKKTAAEVSQHESTGMLVWGGLFSRKHFKLLAGPNIIGRKDKKTPSDLEFDDPEMSRRSVKIDAIPNGQGGFSFTLTVLKALNSVKVNNHIVAVGDSVKLENQASVTLGKTSFTFKCEK